MKNISPQAGCDGQSGGCFFFMREAAVSNGRLAMAGEKAVPPAGRFFHAVWAPAATGFLAETCAGSFCTTAHIGFLRKPTAVSAVAGSHTAFKESRRQVSRTQNRLRKGAGPRQKASGKKGIHAPLFFVNKDLPPAPATKRNSLRRPETIPEWMNSPISFSCLKIGASPVW